MTTGGCARRLLVGGFGRSAAGGGTSERPGAGLGPLTKVRPPVGSPTTDNSTPEMESAPACAAVSTRPRTPRNPRAAHR